MLRLASGLILVVGLAGGARAQLIFPIEQHRHVEGWVEINEPNGPVSDSASADAPDMALWVQDVEAALTSCDGWCTFTSGAGQYSDIGGAALTAYGSTDVDACQLTYLTFDGMARAKNQYCVQFAVAAPVNYELSGFISVSGEVVGSAGYGDWLILDTVDVSLDQIAGPLVYQQQAGIGFIPDPNQPSSDSHTLTGFGQLSPGVYELQVVTDVDCPYLYLEAYEEPVEVFAESSFVVDVVFTPAESPPGCEDADTDDDGDVDLLDFVRFQRCYTGP
jgi:hypothetical protein